MTHPICTYREREGLSQEDLAQKLGVSRVTVSRWETDTRKPDRTIVRKVSEVTGIPVRDLRPDWCEVIEGAAA